MSYRVLALSCVVSVILGFGKHGLDLLGTLVLDLLLDQTRLCLLGSLPEN